jgi:hypothetical protein
MNDDIVGIDDDLIGTRQDRHTAHDRKTHDRKDKSSCMVCFLVKNGLCIAKR